MSDHSNQCRLVKWVREKKGRTHYAENQNIKSSQQKTTFDRWKQLITDTMKSKKMPQKKLCVSMTTAMHWFQYATADMNESKRKNVAKIFLYVHVHCRKRMKEKKKKNSLWNLRDHNDWQHKGFAGSFFYIKRRFFFVLNSTQIVQFSVIFQRIFQWCFKWTL